MRFIDIAQTVWQNPGIWWD